MKKVGWRRRENQLLGYSSYLIQFQYFKYNGF